MAKPTDRWIVKDAEGRIFGPFNYDQVLEQIDRNYFLGSEQVASYPGGDWHSISRTPEFSDRLLDVLSAEVKGSAAQASAPKSRRETTAEKRTGSQTARPSTQAPVTHASALANSEGSYPSSTSSTSTAGPASATTSTRSKVSQSQVIELTDLKAFQRMKQMKQTRLPLLIMGAGVVAGAAALMMSGKGSIGENRIRLISLRPSQPTMADAKLKEKFRHAISAFQTDTFTGYQRAENELVEIAEGASTRVEEARRKAEYLSFLCLTYRELWPFAFQDAKDMKAVNIAMQEAKRLDPGGLHGSICELVNLILNGRTRDAQGLSEAVLLEKSQAPVLFEIRGDLFALSNDALNAANYFSQARSLWPGWQKNAALEAKARSDMKQFNEATQLYRGVLQKVPDHGVAKIELGLIEGLQFNQLDKGLDLITGGVAERVPRQSASRGYHGLAQIYMKKQQRVRARDAAKKAFELDPTNTAAKELLVLLGGDGKVRAGEIDLMFLGEQYMRSADYFSAQAQFKAAFDANGKNGIAAMKAGKCLWQLNQTSDAIDWMRKAIRADPQLIGAYVELADYYAQRFDYYAAVETLRKAQSVQPKGFEVYRGFAIVELRRNNFKGAVGFAANALKLYETDIDTLLIMAKAQIGLQQFSEAQKFAARAIDLDYNNIEAHSLNAKIEAGLHGVDSGVTYIQQMLNRYVITQGRQVPQAAIDLRITLGEIYMQDERFKLAEDIFKQALALDPNSKRAMVALGKCYQAESQGSQALETFLKAAVLDPSDAEPIYYSGQLYADTGKLPDAIKQFERVLRINSRYPKAHAAMGRVELRRGDSKKALDEAMLERAINPDIAEAYVIAAEAYFAMRQYSNCAGEYQKAVSKANQGALLYVRMARCYRLAGSLESAQSLLRQATSIESGNPEIYKEQGAIFHVKGMADDAIGAYDTYIRLAPNSPDRLEVEARIRRVQAGDMELKE